MKKSFKSFIQEQVNSKSFEKGFRKSKFILDGSIEIIASAGWIYKGDTSKYLKITIKDKDREIGWAEFKNMGEHLEANTITIQPAYRRKGIATEVYKFVKELGNDIKQSDLVSNDGKKLWASFK